MQLAAYWVVALPDYDATTEQADRLNLYAALVDRRATIVPIISIQEDLVSGEVEGGISEIIHRIQRVNMDELTIRRAKALAKRCAKMDALGPDREAVLVLRIIYV